MVNVLRKYQQPVMIFITVVIIIAFVVFFQPGNRSAKNSHESGFLIYGRHHSIEELQRKSRLYQVALYAGLNQMVLTLSGGNPYSPQASSEFLFNSFVFEHEANKLGILASDDEVVNAIQKLRPFQTNGAYDPAKYAEFEQTILRPSGFTTKQLEELVRDELRLKKLVALVGSTVETTPGEFRDEYVQNNQKMELAAIRFNQAEFTAAIQPTDAEIEQYFQGRAATYKSAEKRTVSYVKFDLTDAEKALEGKAKMDARQKLANRANDFGQDLLAPNAVFGEVAKKFNLTVKTAADFTETAPPAELASVTQGAATAFKLTEKDATSDPLADGNGYCVLHLERVTPSHPLTLAEARPQVIEQLKAERGNQALISKGNEVRGKLVDAMKAGASFADAAKAAGTKVETYPAFSLASPLEDKPEMQAILPQAVKLAEGELSDFFQAPGGGMIVCLLKREPIDEAQFNKEKAAQLAEAQNQKALVAFVEWLQNRRKAANFQGMQPGGSAPAGQPQEE